MSVSNLYGCAQDDIDAQHNASRGAPMSTECYQLFSLRIADGESNCRGKWHSHIQHAVIPRISKPISDTAD
jgi:hypothetical protein